MRLQGLSFAPLDLPTARLVLLTDASFASAEGIKSQLVYLPLLIDASGTANVIYFGSNMCQRIARSVMEAEVQALVLGFDYAFYVKDHVDALLGRRLDLEAMNDSRSVFNVIAKDEKTTERRWHIDVL